VVRRQGIAASVTLCCPVRLALLAKKLLFVLFGHICLSLRRMDSRPLFQWLVVTSKGQSSLRSRIIDCPFGAFACFLNSAPLCCKHNCAVSGNPCLALILAVDPVKRPPNLVRGLIYLAGCGVYRKSLVVVIHGQSLARMRVLRSFLGLGVARREMRERSRERRREKKALRASGLCPS
jgi:hypothetical protein